jgi:hypothetical protein
VQVFPELNAAVEQLSEILANPAVGFTATVVMLVVVLVLVTVTSLAALVVPLI